MHAAREHRVQTVLHAFDDNPSGFEQASSARTRPPKANLQMDGSPVKKTPKCSLHPCTDEGPAHDDTHTGPSEESACASVAGVEGWDRLGGADGGSSRTLVDTAGVESPSGDTRSSNTSPEENVVILPGDSVSQQNRAAGLEVCRTRPAAPFHAVTCSSACVQLPLPCLASRATCQHCHGTRLHLVTRSHLLLSSTIHRTLRL
jgi:hypothetical protein